MQTRWGLDLGEFALNLEILGEKNRTGGAMGRPGSRVFFYG